MLKTGKRVSAHFSNAGSSAIRPTTPNDPYPRGRNPTSKAHCWTYSSLLRSVSFPAVWNSSSSICLFSYPASLGARFRGQRSFLRSPASQWPRTLPLAGLPPTCLESALLVGLAFADLFGVLYNVNYVENWGVFTFPIWEIQKERNKIHFVWSWRFYRVWCLRTPWGFIQHWKWGRFHFPDLRNIILFKYKKII